VHCEVCPTCTEVGLQETETEMVAVVVTVTVMLPLLVVSWTDVAVTVTVLAVAGAVNNPEELIVPPLADHVTAEL
jgi:hypothetical protein